MGFEETVAGYADSYVRAAIFAVFVHAIADSLMLFMAGMGQTYIILTLQIAVIPFHTIACYLFVYTYGYGMCGAAYAETFTAILTVSL